MKYLLNSNDYIELYHRDFHCSHCSYLRYQMKDEICFPKKSTKIHKTVTCHIYKIVILHQ